MKQIELRAFGIDNLDVVAVARPDPGPGEALVRFGAASINYRDYQIVVGEFSPDQPLPIVPLSDGAGEVAAVGAGVMRLAAGDRVAPLFFPNWLSGPALGAERAQSSGLEVPGVLREYGVYSEQAVARVASHLSDAEAACFACAGLTAWSCLRDLAGVSPGDTVLVQGTGGVAVFGLQLAKAMGATVIVTSSSDRKLESAAALGADHCINYVATPEWGTTARDLTGGAGVDAVIEIGGTGTLKQSFAALRRDGHIAVVGYLAGIDLGLTVFDLIERNAHLHGVSVGNRDSFEAMMSFVAEHELRPEIARSFAFEQAGEALTTISRGEIVGKLVVSIGD
ncbi:MAG: NAD(P)-dependent alcohol dehydrogenase [Gammaproteobacteria bacterium]|nr:NAD(P)-dependent alcohol dehydrogenase [Gammaproteobacteria bacterium]